MNIPHISEIINLIIENLNELQAGKIQTDQELFFSEKQSILIQEYLTAITKHAVEGKLSQEESLDLFKIIISGLFKGNTQRWSQLTRIVSFNRKELTQEQIVELMKFEPKR